MSLKLSTDGNDSGTAGQIGRAWDQLIAPGSPSSWRLLRSNFLRGRRVLITGAGGSIGSALSHAVAASEPHTLVLLDSSETGLYQIDQGLRQAGSREHIAVLASVCDSAALNYLVSGHRPEIIFHAAALKQVPLMEANPFAAIENNVFGTYTMASTAIAHQVEQIVLISTDKAVEPRSVMGASKRIAELIFLTLDGSTRMSVARLCNVMGSRGSVLPLFLKQIAMGGPVTVTDPNSERFFITLDQAVRLILDVLEVLSATTLVVPKTGGSRRILGLAQHLLTLHQSSAAIEFTGLRPGDKLSEQLISSHESLRILGAAGTAELQLVHTQLPPAPVLLAALNLMQQACRRHDLEGLLRVVRDLVPEYQPSSLLLTNNNRTPLGLAVEVPV